ncbi:DUF3086 domain-containing protein [Calothrix sp. 336/3]|uniref:DUF3086 domain-containing protein n=1 Tax=Calothrix sp. 336/3 TaxID=1337936 RepID=UPI0004E428E7|nr:DUF3086 domain-containing protein [Calothrix sp. 336/3]AKG22271.1 small-conductance mechanosensitive channel [Calothrix sp. 336/3]
MNPEEYQNPPSVNESPTSPEESPENPTLETSATEESTLEVTEVVAENVTTEVEAIAEDSPEVEIGKRILELQQQEAQLKTEIANLQSSYTSLQSQIGEAQTAMGKLVQESLSQLEQRKQALQISIEQLEKRQERIRNEMRTTFAGASQDLAIRVQGFKDYLAGSLQDLAIAAEQLQLVPQRKPEPEKPPIRETKAAEPQSGNVPFASQQFQETNKQIRRLIDQYRTKPDYYGPPWQLRRTFEPVHAERVSNWFFTQGGRGALRTMGSRLQNTLIASAIISILYPIYGNKVRTLVLANSPERLGEWRRGLQDCLGIGRPDFGPDRGVVLFETAEAVAQKAERLVKANQMPFIVVDDSEEQISLALLQFPLWLAFAPDPRTMRSSNYDDDF